MSTKDRQQHIRKMRRGITTNKHNANQTIIVSQHFSSINYANLSLHAKKAK